MQVLIVRHQQSRPIAGKQESIHLVASVEDISKKEKKKFVHTNTAFNPNAKPRNAANKNGLKPLASTKNACTK